MTVSQIRRIRFIMDIETLKIVIIGRVVVSLDSEWQDSGYAERFKVLLADEVGRLYEGGRILEDERKELRTWVRNIENAIDAVARQLSED